MFDMDGGRCRYTLGAPKNGQRHELQPAHSTDNRTAVVSGTNEQPARTASIRGTSQGRAGSRGSAQSASHRASLQRSQMSHPMSQHGSQQAATQLAQEDDPGVEPTMAHPMSQHGSQRDAMQLAQEEAGPEWAPEQTDAAGIQRAENGASSQQQWGQPTQLAASQQQWPTQMPTQVRLFKFHIVDEMQHICILASGSCRSGFQWNFHVTMPNCGSVVCFLVSCRNDPPAAGHP